MNEHRRAAPRCSPPFGGAARSDAGGTTYKRDTDALLAEDDAARRRAIDVRASFLVQAPAGSGKTGLLIQRYLALLACVDEPGQVIALTFTKKAAGEMRERVVEALLEADRGDPPAQHEHARVTRRLADAALAQDRRRGWAITEHSSRLRIQTFDALATEVARRVPLAAGLGPRPDYREDAGALYLRAAERALAAASAADSGWRTLLLHFDNQVPHLTKLIAEMLARRDQWLRQVIGKPADTLRAELVSALRAEIVDVLDKTRQAFPPNLAADIQACARAAALVLGQRDETRDHAEELNACAEAGGLPASSVEALPLWRALARLLMVKKSTHFKRSLQEADGFPPIGKGPGAQERRGHKQAMETLCRALDDVTGLAGALAAASRLPDPLIGDDAWRIVEALIDALPRAAAELTTVFASARQTDFVQANLAAIDALGDAETPSDLLLQLDAKVHHLLVDEFQDTSYVQLRLLERLTCGWVPGDGRTMFAVGDPMQSIYRFREAEVAFFLEAQERGAVCGLPVERLKLRRNFRSQADVVDWCNDTFAQVLGRVRDPARGVVPFEPAVAARDACAGLKPSVDLLEDASDEAARVVELIRAAQADGANDIAVLVRARSHLAVLLPALRRARVAFAAVELDPLSQRQAILDLVALTHALLQPADRAAWLAVLRAPWCGLTLADLLAIGEAAGLHPGAAIPRAFDDLDAMAGVSSDGRRRLGRALEALQPALEARGEASAVDRVRGAWLALGGPLCLDDPLDLDAAALYFDLLSAHERAGDLPDWDAFLAALDALRASAVTTPNGGVQIMTMHKAKGLEFDTIILTGLGREGSRSDAPLLRWRRRRTGVVIAPAKSRGGEPDPLYRYLARLDADEEDAELGRLLYVASTRAKTRLHLVAAPGTRVDPDTGARSWNDPIKLSSLAKLWPALKPELPFAVARGGDAALGGPPPLRRLPLAFPVPVPDGGASSPLASTAVPAPQPDLPSPPFDWVRETTRRIGMLAHRLLARIAAEGLQAWPYQRIQSLQPRVRADLSSAGFTPDELPAAVARVLEAVQRTLDDPRGRWLFDVGHDDARSEWALSGVDGGHIVRVVIDRTFVAGGERWIVDFKTSTHEGGDAATFLDSEVARYRDQMTRYARLMRGLDPRPTRLALYYPLIEGGFREIGNGDADLSAASI